MQKKKHDLPNVPSISVIVPMYNAEKYILDCLGSILGQTFQDFEVIVVDDCSKDKSTEIIENIIPEFNGRLRLIKLKKNSGYGSIPRNEGLKVARGKYVYFCDNDDALVKNALENFFTVAENNNADLLICKNWLISYGVNENFFKEARLCNSNSENDNQVELVTNDLSIRLEAWRNNMFSVQPWLKFIRRDLLIDNDIKFLSITQEDSLWTLELICVAKKIIFIPQICYLHRLGHNSLGSEIYGTEINPVNVRKKFERVIVGLKHIDEFIGKIEFFQNNPVDRYLVIDHILNQNISWLMNCYGNFSEYIIYENIKEAFKKETGDFDVLISYFVSSSIRFYKIISGKK